MNGNGSDSDLGQFTSLSKHKIFTKPFQNNQNLYEWDMKAFI